MFEYKLRQRVFIAIIGSILGLLLVRIAWLQLIDASRFTAASRNTALREIRVLPARGVVYDRNGVLMVDNEPTYTVTLTPRYFNRDRIGLLASIVGVDDSVVVRKLNEAQDWNSFRPSPAFLDVGLDVIGRLEENRYLLGGVGFHTAQKRRYLTGARAGHALGYVREITESELNRLRVDGYRQGDLIGRAGLERTYEGQLRGGLGSEFRLVNKFGREFRAFRDGQDDLEPVSGFDLHLTLDHRVQALAETLFVNKRGAAVAIDPANGALIALVSQPDVDPRIFSSRVTPEEWRELQAAEDDPLFNRATMSEMPPGSTWKPFMALVGLETGIIRQNTVYRCRGRYVLGRRAFRDHNEIAHGDITVERAIQESCNSFFFNLMMKLDVNTFSQWGRRFGFGQRVDLDIAEQSTGLMPDSAYYDRTYPLGWTAGFSINLGIGQGDMLVTPMQLARYVAAIANGGTLHTPHLVEAIRHPETGEEIPVKPATSTTVPIDAKYFQIVRNGMRRVMEYTTGRGSQIEGIASGGKSGTAQAPGGKQDHSIFVLFAPFDDPQIAIAVFVENGGYGAVQAGPIASLMAEQYLTGELGARARWRKSRILEMVSE